MHYPKISVVTANFNGVKFLEETIKSVLSQNYPNLEYIIIDGGSTDGSVELIQKYSSYLKFWISEKDKGLYEALQKGFDKSTGEIMGWLNSDDLYHPEALFTLSEIFLKHKEVNWLQGIPTIVDERGRTVNVQPLRRWSKLDYYLGNYQWIQQESTFWRRSLWNRAGKKMAVNMKYAGDLELWLRFFRYEKLFVTSALIGAFRQHSKGQLSLDYMDQYKLEAEKKISEEVDKNIPEEEKLIIQKIYYKNRVGRFIRYKIIRKIIYRLLFPELNKLIEKKFSPAPKIHFDRFKQDFIIQD